MRCATAVYAATVANEAHWGILGCLASTVLVAGCVEGCYVYVRFSIHSSANVDLGQWLMGD